MIAVVGCAQPPEDVERAQTQEAQNQTEDLGSVEKIPIDVNSSLLEFEGYAPGKSHVGNFEYYSGYLLVRENQIVGIEGVINASTVKSDSERLENHLRSDDFFDVEQFPTIEFTDVIIVDGILTGNLLFRGITKQITVPVVVTENSVSTEFLLDTTEFNFKYIGVNKDVRIAFTMSI